MKIVIQSSPTRNKPSNPLRLLVWTTLLTLSSLSYLLSLLPRKYAPIPLRLTRRLPHLHNLLRIPHLQSQTLLLLPQLENSSQFRCLKMINLKLQNFLHLIHSCWTLDPFFHAPITPNFNLITLFLDVNIAMNTKLITHGAQSDHASISLKPEFSTWEIIFWDGRCQEYTIQRTSLPSQRLVVPPQAITAFSPWCRSTLLHQFFSLNLLLTHLSCCATLPQRVSPSLNYFADCLHKSFHLMLLLLTNPSLTALSSHLLFSRQINLSRMPQLINHLLDLHPICPHLSNIRRTVYRLTTRLSNQHLKAEHLDRQTLQLIVLQLQNDFALLRYLLYSQVETSANKDAAVKNSATSLQFNPNPNLKPNPISSAFQLPGPGEPKLRRSTPVGAVGSPRAKTICSAHAEFQPTPNTHEAPPTTVHNLRSRICKLEKMFADEIATYTSITAGIHFQYFFLHDKIRQLEHGNSDAII